MLLFGEETWVLTAAMSQTLKGGHVRSMWRVTGKKKLWLGDDYWRKVAAESVFQAAGKKLSIPKLTRGRQQCQSG